MTECDAGQILKHVEDVILTMGKVNAKIDALARYLDITQCPHGEYSETDFAIHCEKCFPKSSSI